MPKIKDRELKLKLIEDNKYKEIRKLRGEINREIIEKTKEIFFTPAEIEDIIKGKIIESGYSLDEIRVSDNLVNSRNRKYKRGKDYISWLLTRISKGKKAYFVTLTFKTLDSTEQARRKRVNRYLNQFEEFIANIDFGADYGREHYHALILTDNEPLLHSWNSGFYDIQEIRLNDSNVSLKLSKYIQKLANHSIKHTTEDHRTIYPTYAHRLHWQKMTQYPRLYELFGDYFDIVSR